MSIASLSKKRNVNIVGKILFPNDWRQFRLKDLLEPVSRPVEMKDDETYRLVTIKRRFGGMVERGHFLGKQIEVKSQFTIKSGDFVISKRQISHGACAIVPEYLDGAIVSNEYTVLRNKEELNLDFFKWYVQLPFMQKYFFISSHGVHIEKLLFKLEVWLRNKVCIPNVHEQQKIADILSTWDKAIELKEKLIEQKKEQKKGLMQRLLTGKVRLPRFKGEWKEVRLGSIGSAYNGLTGKNKEDFGSGKPYIPYKNVFNGSRINIDQLEYVQISETENQNKVKYGDIIFTASSETPEEVGMSSVLLDHVDELYLNSFCFGYRLNDFNTLIPEFAQYLFRGNVFRKELLKLAQGSTRFNLSKNEVLKIKIKIPGLEEQKKIAFVLTIFDREIDLLEQELEFLKQQKKGLMQLLLTGKVRVRY